MMKGGLKWATDHLANAPGNYPGGRVVVLTLTRSSEAAATL